MQGAGAWCWPMMVNFLPKLPTWRKCAFLIPWGPFFAGKNGVWNCPRFAHFAQNCPPSCGGVFEHTPTNAHTSCMYGLQIPIQMGGAMPYTRAVPTVSPCRVMVDVVTNLPRLVGVGKSGDVVAIMRLTCWLLH